MRKYLFVAMLVCVLTVSVVGAKSNVAYDPGKPGGGGDSLKPDFKVAYDPGKPGGGGD